MQSIPMFIRGVRVRGMDTFHVYHKATGGADRRDLYGGGLYVLTRRCARLRRTLGGRRRHHRRQCDLLHG